MVRPVNQNKLDIWMYQLMLGTLPKEKKRLLRKELKKRYEEDTIFNILELKIYTAMTVDRPFQQYLGELLANWEKRS